MGYLISDPADMLQHFIIFFPIGNCILRLRSFIHLLNIFTNTILAVENISAKPVKTFISFKKSIISLIQIYPLFFTSIVGVC